MASILDNIDILKVKPLPKKTTNYTINFQTSMKAPKVIDKTTENLIDPTEFMKTFKKDVINKTDDFYKESVEKLKETQKLKSLANDDPFKEHQTKLKTQFESINYITNIEKTEQKIIIKQITGSIKDSKTIGRETPAPELKSKTKKTKAQTFATDLDFDQTENIGDESYENRMPEVMPNVLIKADSYYLNNREKFIEFINKLFLPYKEELLQQDKDIASGKINISCDATSENDFSLLIHQKIVRDYINLYTPYRGLLVFHGLGSGKTCSSIAITEGLKHEQEVIIMTPASLRANYVEELKKCGDYLYKKNQYWEFISVLNNPEYISPLSSILKVSEEYIKKKGGAWFINKNKEPNYESTISLDPEQKASLDEQIDMMIAKKYKFLSYNGLRNNSGEWISITQNNKVNPFSNKVVIIDEAHNLISRIVNKLSSGSALSMKIYKYLMDAENCKIILLSGTPIINYPNEIAVLFNILRGYIKCYTYNVSSTKKMYNIEYFEALLKKNAIYSNIDHIEYNSKTKDLKVYKNPFGFKKNDINDANDSTIVYSSDGISSDDFATKIKTILKEASINVKDSPNNHITNNLALPDKFDDFKYYFIDANGELKNNEMFLRRIIGLTSYFRSAQEQLMPSYTEDDYNIVEIPMSDFQFNIYEEARVQERKVEKQSKTKKKSVAGKDDLYDDGVSTYRIFSRAFCNYVFPRPHIKRPMPKNEETLESAIGTTNNIEIINEDILEDVKGDDFDKKVNEMDGNLEKEDIDELKKETGELKDSSYSTRLSEALKSLEKNSSKYLNKEALKLYSPKFLNILENIEDEERFGGINMLYSQFKTLEGIGIFKLVLKEHGFLELKIKRLSATQFELDVNETELQRAIELRGKPQFFASYTGSEKPEEREVILNILNSNWKIVPQNIIDKIKKYNPSVENNNNGEVVKLLMISSSGAEGISLKNVRFVHIMEPYWHPVRKNQVIGRARRICSHADLPKELQNVTVLMYLMKFTDEQLKGKNALELLKKDRSKYTKDPVSGQYMVHTSDQYLNEVADIKEKITSRILDNVKRAAIDCTIHSRSTTKEQIQCYLINSDSKSDNLMYNDNIKDQLTDKAMTLNKKEVKDTIIFKTIKGKKYAINKAHTTQEYSGERILYDYDAMKGAQKALIAVGKFSLDANNKVTIIA